jgi:DNA ligase D-like protein (predicted ligase)
MIAAMAATLTDDRFDDPAWIFERKLDGIRCLARTQPAELRSRNGLDLGTRFPTIAEAVASLPSAVLDGEVVSFDGSRTSFQRLGQRGRAVYFYVFDILESDGQDLRALPLLERKRLLRELVKPHGPIRLTPYRREKGLELYEEACRRGWEGLIAKRADSPYVGKRSRDWLKWKCDMEQELVVGGYTAPKGSRIELGALLVGVYEGDRLRYAGKVGTGFGRETLRDLAARLAPLVRDDSPFADAPRLRNATWVEPRLVAQVGFTEWTRDGRLRHPRFVGLREDKDPSSVVREVPS